MKQIAIISLICLSLATYAQNDDPFAVLNKNVKPSTVVASATFKSTRVINGHSIETMAKKHLDFRISHHFGTLNEGAYGYYGMDQAAMRLGLEYGVTDDLMLGLGLNPAYSTQKATDFFAKYKLIKQTSGAKNIPVTITLLESVNMNGLKSSDNMPFYNNTERLTYCTQIMIARKITDGFSLQITPTYLHRNKVFLVDPSSTTEVIEGNDMLAIGFGGRLKISKRTSLNAEYFYRLPSLNSSNPNNNTAYHNSLSVGVDIETGGHVFQLHFTNSIGMTESQFIAQTTDSWSNGGVHWGFNLSRTFSFDSEKKKGAW